MTSRLPALGAVGAVAVLAATGVAGAGSSDPVLGESVVVAPVRGDVRIASGTGKRYAALRSERRVRVGSLLDTRRGTVRLSSAGEQSGAVQSGRFRGGVFQVSQSPHARGLTVLTLRGSFRRCGSAPANTEIRRLEARAEGSFRTRARFSSATVVGTVWLQKDTCTTTTTAVKAGTVVVRDAVRGRSVTVRAGKRYVARR